MYSQSLKHSINEMCYVFILDESPNKKRKIEGECSTSAREVVNEEKVNEASNETVVRPSCSNDRDSSVLSEESVSSSTEINWLERLQTTVTSLIEALRQKHAREETS